MIFSITLFGKYLDLSRNLFFDAFPGHDESKVISLFKGNVKVFTLSFRAVFIIAALSHSHDNMEVDMTMKKNKEKNLWKLMFGAFVMLLLVPQAFAFSVNDILENNMPVEIGTEAIAEKVGCLVPEQVPEDYQGSCYPIPPQPFRPKIDVVFVIDSTGSMADEIRSVKMHLINLINEVRNGQPSPDLRVGVSTYRDWAPQEQEYNVKTFDLTRNIDHALNYIKNIHAAGGGDYPEAVATGLDTGINHMNWRQDARKLIFLIGDAPPHGEGSRDMSFHQGMPDGKTYERNIRDAITKGITIYTVSGSGMDHIGVNIWKQIARKTGGDYEKLDYYRVAIEQYVEENQLDEQWVEEVQEYADYDHKSKSFLSNTFGSFAKMSIQSEAAAMGVSYDDVDTDTPDTGVLTGDTIVDTTHDDFHDYEPENESRFYRFMKSVLNRMIFWG